MKIRHPGGGLSDKVDQQMTPMIDIVFQLLTFFIMSFKIVAVEGDFNIKMPAPASQGAAIDPDNPYPPITIRLEAGAGGGLAGIYMGDRPLSNFAELRSEVIGIVGTESGPDSAAAMTEVELDADYNLKYQHIIEAITAVSGYVKSDRTVGKLIEKIKFAPPRSAP